MINKQNLNVRQCPDRMVLYAAQSYSVPLTSKLCDALTFAYQYEEDICVKTLIIKALRHLFAIIIHDMETIS